VDTQRWREKSPPRELPSEGVLIGTSSTDITRSVRVGVSDRLRHVYVVGQTGTGKTTLLRTMILDDIAAGHGLCVIDPHGDLFQELVDSIPDHRRNDVILIDPTYLAYPVGLNMLEWHTEGERHFIAQEFAGILNRLLHDEFGPSVSEMAGPVFFQHVRMNTLLAMSDPREPGTLIDLYAIFEEPGYWRRWVPLKMRDTQLQRWVDTGLPNADYIRTKPGEVSVGSWIASKFTPFVFDPMLRNVFGQRRSTVDLRDAMDRSKVVLVNLAKGQLTEANSRFFGMVILAKLQTAAMSRAALPADRRQSFFVYVDEFQSVATENFVTLLSEARKFGLGLVLSNQFVSQLENSRISEAIFGNVGTMVAFRVGARDAEIVEREMGPALGRSDVLNLPNWTAYVSTLVDGQVTPPFSIRTIPAGRALGSAEAIRDASRERYSRSREEVEAGMEAQAEMEDPGREDDLVKAAEELGSD
jgi:type IV secretory pathway TraG/TraD family ATPase VirD4